MTIDECVIVSAYTGYCMVKGEYLGRLYKYAEKTTGIKPVFTHMFADPRFNEILHENSKTDFLELCKKAQKFEETILSATKNNAIVKPLSESASEESKKASEKAKEKCGAHIDEWIYTQNESKISGVDEFICSSCGLNLKGWARYTSEKFDGEYIPQGAAQEYEFRFCPNCGRKVKERYE